jgi:hypothetical protein
MTKHEAKTMRDLLRAWSARLRTSGHPVSPQLIKNVCREIKDIADTLDKIASLDSPEIPDNRGTSNDPIVRTIVTKLYGG